MHTSHRHQVDYGPPVTIRVCVLKTDDVSDARAEALIGAIRHEFLKYGLVVEVPWMRTWKRPGFQPASIVGEVVNRPLEAPCDRLVGLVDRHVGDFAWSLLLPETLGAVEYVTSTRGYFVATYASLNQILARPGSVAVHEFYHMLGCRHDVTLTACYRKIAMLKASINPAADFFPGVTMEGQVLTTRDAVDAALRSYLNTSMSPPAQVSCQNARRPRDVLACASSP